MKHEVIERFPREEMIEDALQSPSPRWDIDLPTLFWQMKEINYSWQEIVDSMRHAILSRMFTVRQPAYAYCGLLNFPISRYDARFYPNATPDEATVRRRMLVHHHAKRLRRYLKLQRRREKRSMNRGKKACLWAGAESAARQTQMAEETANTFLG